MPCLTVGPSSPTPSLANGYVRSLFGQCCMWRAFLVLISLVAQSGVVSWTVGFLFIHSIGIWMTILEQCDQFSYQFPKNHSMK
jgi:hypothetical protein